MECCKRLRGEVLVFMAVIVLVKADRSIYMDSPTACNQNFPVGEREVFIVKPRGSVGVSNPPARCVVYFESSYGSNNYKFEIKIEAANVADCGLTLKIYDGQSTAGSDIRTIGCGSTESTGFVYSKDRAISLVLMRTRDQYVFGSDFQLRIQLYYDQTAATEYIGTYKFPVGAIVGIVLGVIVIIVAAILLGWCYKTGRLPGFDPYKYPSGTMKASSENLSKSDAGLDGDSSKNGGFVSWHGKESQSVVESRSNFGIDDSSIFQSLTSLNAGSIPPKRDLKPVTVPVAPPLSSGLPRGRTTQNGRDAPDNNRSAFKREDPKQLSNSPIARKRTSLMRNAGTFNTEAEKDEYHTINDMERETDLSSKRTMNGKGTFGSDSDMDKKKNSEGVFVNPDKEGYMYDYEHVQKLSGEDEVVKRKKTQDFGEELKDAIKRASLRRELSGNATSDSEGLVGVQETTNDDSSNLSSNATLNKTDGDITGPDAQSSPKPKKKKRKSSKGKSKKPKKSDGKISNSNTALNADDMPPEIFAPIFSGDEEAFEAPNQYQPGYQGNYPPAAQFDPRYPMGPYQPGMYPPGGYPPGMPFQQAGQAQWYVEANPNGQHKMAFAMTTHSQSDDGLGQQSRVGPNYTSTPYNSKFQRSQPNDMSVVPAGTVLDDPQVPEPGTALVRYDDNPISGIKTSQVVWTDAKRDPTDPPPDSATQVTRKTITRITTRATKDELPDAPNPSLQDMSWRTAQGIQESHGMEPPFMSPTRGAYQPSAIQYASETPERSNAGYYMGSQIGSRTKPVDPRHQPAMSPVIHNAPKGNQAIKDRITLKYEPAVDV